MFYKVLYINTKNSRDREVKYLRSLKDVAACAPSGKVASVVTRCSEIPSDFILYDSTRSELFL